MSDAQLTAKVKAVNLANAYAMELYPVLAKIFGPFVGYQIEKKDGPLLAKIAKLLPEMPCTTHIHVTRYPGNCILAWLVKTCEMYSDHSCLYHEVMLYIGHMSNGILDSLYDTPHLRTDYTVEEIEEARRKFRTAQKIAEDLKPPYPFGD